MRSGKVLLLGVIAAGSLTLAASRTLHVRASNNTANPSWTYYALQWHSESGSISGPYSVTGLPEASSGGPLIEIEIPPVEYKNAVFAPVLQVRSVTAHNVPVTDGESAAMIADALWTSISDNAQVADLENWFSRGDVDGLIRAGSMSSARVSPLAVTYFVSAATFALLLTVQIGLLLAANRSRFFGADDAGEEKCRACGYPIRGFERCPECSAPNPNHSQSLDQP